MQEIKDRLRAGQASGEVIAQGYAPPTVYKVQRQLRQDGLNPAEASPPMATAEAADESAARVKELEDEVQSLEAWVESLAEDASQLTEAKNQMAEAKVKVDELETARDSAVRRAESLEAQLRELSLRTQALESNASEAVRLRQVVADQRRQLQEAANDEAEWHQTATGWQKQFETEQANRVHAEQQWAAWANTAGQRGKESAELSQRIAQLEPLRVWDGHPCKACGKSMRGAVSREAAAKLMREFAHSKCIDQNSGSGFGLIAAAAGLYGLSKLR
jgi:hypothetical protein